MPPKRKQTNDAPSLKSKMKKTNKPSTSTTSTTATEVAAEINAQEQKTQITDLNFDCLLALFERLDRISIENISQLHETFAEAARKKLKRFYGKQYNTLTINATGHVAIGDVEIPSKRLLGVLQVFGEFISKVHIESILIGNEYMWPSIGAMLKNVEDVMICKCDLTAPMSEFSKWFPEMKRLQLVKLKTFDGHCVAQPFETLMDVKIELELKAQTIGYQLSHGIVRKMLEENPQITSLDLNVKFGSDLLFQINKWAPNLKHISLTCETTKPSDWAKMELPSAEKICENVTNVELELMEYPITENPNPTYANSYVYRWNHIQFRLNKTCETNESRDGILKQIAALFPNAVEVGLSGDLHLLSSDGLASFMRKLPKLKEIRFKVIDSDNFKDLRKKIGKRRWRLKDNNQSGYRNWFGNRTRTFVTLMKS